MGWKPASWVDENATLDQRREFDCVIAQKCPIETNAARPPPN